MKKITILFYVSLLILFIQSSCTSETKPENTQDTTSEAAIEVPILLERHPNLRNEKEWDMVQNQYGKAKEDIRLNNRPDEARFTLAQLFVNEARITGEHGHYYPASLAVLDAAMANRPEDKDLTFRLLSTKAGVLLSLHKFQEAHKIGEQALQLNPYNSGIYGIMVDANVELGRYDRAVEMADKMVAIRPDLRSYSRVSYLREIHGDWKGAIEAMQMAVKAGFPGFEQTSWTRLTLGDLYAEYGDKEQAKKQYEVVLANRPDYPFAIAALAKLEMENKKYDEAEQLLNRAAEIIPEFSFYQDLAEIYRATGRQEAFEETTKELFLMIADDEANGHRMDLEKAVIYAHLLEDYDKALAAAEVSYRERPENIDVNRIMADIHIRAGSPEKARPYLSVAVKTNSQKPELLRMQQALAMK